MATKQKPAAAAAENTEELVEIKLNRIPGQGSDQSQFVAVNGKSWLIRRGEWVQVPRYVALVLEESQKRRDLAEDLMTKLGQ